MFVCLSQDPIDQLLVPTREICETYYGCLADILSMQEKRDKEDPCREITQMFWEAIFALQYIAKDDLMQSFAEKTIQVEDFPAIDKQKLLDTALEKVESVKNEIMTGIWGDGSPVDARVQRALEPFLAEYCTEDSWTVENYRDKIESYGSQIQRGAKTNILQEIFKIN